MDKFARTAQLVLPSHENAIFTPKPLSSLTRYKREFEGAAARELLLGPAY